MLPLPLLPGVLLPWLLLGAGVLQRAAAQPAGVSCGPQGCYAVYGQRRSFLEAWRSCRELGGNLATLKRPEEAAQVGHLLRSPAGDLNPEPPRRRLFWIGLQRPPRHCYPHRPLRGFSWTTGDQETAYTNWATPPETLGSAGHSPSCSAPRCVVLDDQDLAWLEGSCTVPVDGFLCRFAFPGMCPGLQTDGADQGAWETLSYTTPFGPARPDLLYVPFGTVAALSCKAGAGASTTVSVLCLEKEDGSTGWSKAAAQLCREDGPVYPQASWCEGDNGGCQQLCLDEGSGYACECHDGYYLLPDGHSCAMAEHVGDRHHHDDEEACQGRPCPFGCVAHGEGYRCQCPSGYELSGDGHQCHDVDECAEEAPCEHQCENTEGSFLCRCHLGFSPSDEEPGQCIDTDECQFPGVCQQMCVNYVGGFECYCTEGYDLDTDGISCLPVAQLPPSATAQSHPGDGGGFFQPFGVAHGGWPPEQDFEDHPYLDDRLAASDPFSVFQDIHVASPDSPSIPDPRVVPRMVPDTEHPNLHLAPLDWSPPPPLEPHLPSLELNRTPDTPPATPATPSAIPTTSPPPSPTHSLLPTPTDAPQGPLDHSISDPPTPFVPMATLSLPGPTDLPDIKGGAAVWGVRALPPTLPSPSPTPGEEGGRPKRDDRWLLVTLLVPICVFVVIMLALGIVYCTRCGAQAKTRSVTQCYRWVISSAGKGAPPPSSSRPCQPATCRTSV